MSLNGWNLIRRWMSAGWNVSFLATSILGIISLAPVNAAERSDRLPERDWIQPQLQALARSSDRSPIHLKSGRFLPIGRVEQNLTAIRATASGENAIHVIVQFDTTPDAASWQSLLAEGVELQGYLPANAFLARVANQTSADRLGRLGVKWVGGIYPEDKVPSRFQSSGIGTWALHPDGSADLRVKYHADVPFETAAEKIQTTGARIIASDRKLGEFTVNATAASVANLSALDCIRWIEEVPPPRMPNNDGIRGNVQAGEVQEEPYDLSGAGVAVGIWDAGDVDTLHGDLTNRVTLAESSGVPHFHSTHVAGTLAGDGTVSLAAGGTDHQWRGVAPAVQIVSYDFQNSVPEHDSAIDTYDVILSQNSWGLTISEFLGNCSLYGDYSSMAPDYDRIATGIYGRALNVVFAAGNLRRGTDTNSCGVGPYGTMGPPSTAKNVIAVGAIHSDDNSMPVFSSWGPLADGRLKPELVAPGAQVTGDHGITSTSPGGSYLVLQGTSMAAPVVSGAIALLTEDFRRLYNNQNPLPGTIKGLLTHTAADLDDETTWYNRGPDYASGYGRLQVRNAVDQLRAGGFLIARVGNAVTNSYQLTADGTATEIRVTLVWDDPAGLENAATALVNDLDLVVLDPNGVRHYPWTLNPINPAAPAVRSAEDHMNVLEQVVADGPVTPGNWTVQVVGHNVPINAPQKYTLVFSPATIPVPSILTVESAAFREDTGGGANGNGVIEPGEEVLGNVVLRNTDGPTVSNLTGRLVSEMAGVTLLQSESAYPDLVSGGTSTNGVPYAFRVSKTLACGTPVMFHHVASYGTFEITNWFSVVIGQVAVTNGGTNVFLSTDVPRAIPDGGFVASTNSVDTPGLIRDLDVSVRIDHTWYGDLQIELEHPDGSRVVLVPASGNSGQNLGAGDCSQSELHTIFDDEAAGLLTSGSAPFSGSFRPSQPLAMLDGKRLDGIWRLRVDDRALEDTGTLLCWSLKAVYDQNGYVCTVFNRAPVTSDSDVNVFRDTEKQITIAADDPDGDPVQFRLLTSPLHGVIASFNAGTGSLSYIPATGYSGPDGFTVEVSDGYTNVTASVAITVLPPLADLILTQSAFPSPVGVGQDLTLTLSVTNAGPNGATGLMLTNRLPAGLVFSSATGSQGSGTNDGGLVVWNVGNLGVGATSSITIVASPTQPGFATNSATITAVEGDLDDSNNSTTALLDVRLTADLSVTGAALPPTVLLGDPAALVATITNPGPSAATHVRVSSALPQGFTLIGVEVPEGNWTNDSNTIVWDLGQLDIGGSAVLRVHVLGNQVGAVTNAVSVVADEVDPNPDDNHAAIVASIVPAADLAVVATALPAISAVGHEIQYQVGVTNSGPGIAHNVTLVDSLSPFTELISVALDQGTWTNVAGTITFELGDLPPGGNLPLIVTVSAISLGSVTNALQVSAVEADVHPADNQTEVVTEVRLAADLALSVIGAPTPVLIGRDAVFDFSVTNGGPGTAHGTTLRYKLPVGVLLTSFVASQGFVTNENGILTFYFGEVPVTGVANARIVMTPQAVGTLTNAVSVVAEEVDPNPSDNQLELVWTVVPAVDLQVAQRVEPDPSLLGEPFQIEIAVTNAGPSVASEIQIDDPLSGTLELIDISVSQGTWTNSGAHITWFADALPPSGEARATLTVRGIGIGAITNIVTASASQQDLNPTDNVAVAVLHVDPAADLALSAEVNPVAAILGQSVSYQLTVTNLGPGDATGVVLVESPPAGVNVIDVEISQGSWTNLSGQILVNFGDVGAGGNANARIVVQPVAVGTITNSASVTAAEADPRALNNGANTISIVELDADLFVELTASATSVLLGKDLVYQIGVTNNGPNTAHTVRIDDVLPTGATVMSVVLEQGTWTNFSGALRWDAGSLPPGTGAAATVTVQIGIAGIATNVVMVASDQVDTNTVNNSASSVVTVMPSADLALEQRVEPDPGWLGQELAFVITVTNRGPSVAHSVTVIDDLPIGITLLRIESSQGVSTNYAGRVTWNAGELAVGATAGISLIFRADQTGSFANNARVSADEIDEHVSDNLSAANATVVPAVDLQVTQQVQPLLAVTGETATYEIIVTNAGPSLATGLILTDTLPGGVTLTDVQASGGIVTNSGDVVSIAFGALDVGETATATIVVTPNAAGTMTNSVVVSAEQPDVAPADNRSIAINTVKVEADLALSIPPRSAVALVGFDLPYSFSITNQGPAEAHDVLLIDQLPADADLTRVEPSQGSWTETNGIVRCELGSLAPGAVATVNIVVRTLVSGGMTNVATVDADVLDRNPTNNVQVTVDTVYPPADLQITQTASADPVLVNDQLTYRITVLNESPYAVPQLVVTDTLPAGTELTSTATTYGSITNDQTTVTFDLGGLAPGGSATLTLTVTPRVVGMITNHAEIVSPFASPANAGLISILATRVIATPLLEVERSGNRLIFSWPEIAGSYLLEYTDQLGNSAVWAEVQSPVVVVNERVTVTVKIFGEARFFRLRKI